MPSGLVIQAVPAIDTSWLRTEVISAADNCGGFTGSALAGTVVRASAAATNAARAEGLMVPSLP